MAHNKTKDKKEETLFSIIRMMKKHTERVIDNTLTPDKEWTILSGSNDWTLVSLNLNDHRKKWNKVRTKIAETLKSENFKPV